MTKNKPQWELVGSDCAYWFWRQSGAKPVIYQVTKSDKPPTINSGYLSLPYLIDIKNCNHKTVTGHYRID